MAHETTASYGAWCAVKSTLPTQNHLSAISSAKSETDRHSVIRSLFLTGPETSGFGIENVLLFRYAHAALIIGQFFTPISAELFRYVREEFDWYNILILTKNILSAHDNNRTRELLFFPPVATLLPPDPSEVVSLSDISSSYNSIYPAPILAELNESAYRPEKFFVHELTASICRLVRLYGISSSLGKSDSGRFFKYIRAKAEPLNEFLSPDTLPPTVRAAFAALLRNTSPTKHEEASDKPDPVDVMMSPYARFIDLMDARKRIQIFCASVGRSARVYAAP
ncbi:MAG TPA: hypothetical protein VF857_09045 [Spirochaetota bacterium]